MHYLRVSFIFSVFAISLSLLFINTVALGQSKKDTIILSYKHDQPYRVKVVEYDANKVPIKAVFAKQMDGILTREDRFMMGIQESDVAGLLMADSILFFDERGRIIERRIKGMHETYINHFYPNAITNRPWTTHRNSDEVAEFIFPKGGLILDRKIVFEAKIGEILHKDVAIRSLFEGKTELRVTSSDPTLSCPTLFTVDAGVKMLPTSCIVADEVKKIKINLDNFLGDTASFLMVIMGFDLKADDFVSDIKEAQEVVLANRKKIILKSEGSEKLLRLVRGDEVVEYFKYSKIRNEINLKGFRKGDYTLEAVDLSTNDVKFAKLKIL